MLIKKGFTLIEMLFTLSIIIVISCFTLTYSIKNKPAIPIDKESEIVLNFLLDAKSEALVNHCRVDIIFTNNTLKYGIDKELVLDEKYFFEDFNDFYFNRNGNISSGGHFMISSDNDSRKIILNVGSGAMYVKK